METVVNCMYMDFLEAHFFQRAYVVHYTPKQIVLYIHILHS